MTFEPKARWTKAEVAANREKWIAALESGDYKQGKNALLQTFPGGGPDQYCCLGVACEVLGVERAPGGNGYKVGDEVMYGLPKAVVTDALGLTFRDGQYGLSSLATNNDYDGKTFAEIAAILRNPPPGLFNK